MLTMFSKTTITTVHQNQSHSSTITRHQQKKGVSGSAVKPLHVTSSYLNHIQLPSVALPCSVARCCGWHRLREGLQVRWRLAVLPAGRVAIVRSSARAAQLDLEKGGFQNVFQQVTGLVGNKHVYNLIEVDR